MNRIKLIAFILISCLAGISQAKDPMIQPSNGMGQLTFNTLAAETSHVLGGPSPNDYLVIDLSGGANTSSYPVAYLNAVPPGGWTDEYKTEKLVLRLIPAGTYTMGSPIDELGRGANETQHEVTLTQPFYIGVFEVTQRQWERVMGTWPSYFNNASYRDSRPVEQVSYNNIRGASAGAAWPANNNVDADSFMGRMRARTGKTFDLPTESQWEYAGRAGTTTALNSGYNLTNTSSDPQMAAVGRYWFNGGSGYTQNGDTNVATAKVGSYLPNQWGLYDIHGNAWEWCLDWYPGYEGTHRVLRGGSWGDGALACRVAYRGCYNPSSTFDYGMSFRVILTISKAAATVTLNDLDQVYNSASSAVVTATTDPVGLTVDVTYNGSVTAPSNAGTYVVTGTVNDVAYQGYSTGALIVAKATQAITFTNPGEQAITDNLILIATASSSLPVSFAVADGPASLSGGSNLTFSATGQVSVVASQAGDANWNPAPSITNTFMVATSTANDYLVIDLSGGADTSSYPVAYLNAVPPGGWTDEYKTEKLVLRLIPAGTYTMGSPIDELGRGANETQHEVTLAQPFYIGVFEVTQRQWERVMGTWPSYFSNTSYRDSRPVEQVSYNNIRGASAGAGWPANNNVDADSFMGRIRARTGKAFDLPTESQWEYAGRAGTTTALNSGYNLTNTSSDAHMAAIGRYWFNGGSEYTQNGDTNVATAKVGSYLPNQWGLYDIHGNAWEWCLDWYPGHEGTHRVLRGGSWGDGTLACRVAYRGCYNPSSTFDYGMSFRVILTTPKAVATVTLNDLDQIYNSASSAVVTATTDPVGLTVDITYNGSVTAPSNAGAYVITGLVNDVNYQGVTTGALIVAKAAQVITFPNPGAQAVTNTLILTATASSSLPISFAVADGPASLSGASNLSFSATGQVSVVASQAGDANWNPAPSITNTFMAGKATAQITLNNLNRTYNGNRRWVSATTSPSGLSVRITYDGLLSAPSNVGSYFVTGVVNDAVYTGSATGTLVIGKVDQTITFTSHGNQLRTARVVLHGQASSGLPVRFIVLSGPGLITASSNLSFTGIGDVRIAARQPGNASWNAAPQVVVTITVINLAMNDYNGDGISDLAAFNPAIGGWAIGYSGGGTTNATWGFLNSTTVCGDYDGDGKADLGVFYNVTGRWYIRTVAGKTLAYNFAWGWPSATPVSGDYDGDGKDDLAVYDEAAGKWYIWSLAKNQSLVWDLPWGWPGAKPVAGDYDGDGRSDLAVLDVNIGHWYIYSLATANSIAWNVAWGWAGCAYVPGDFDGDKKSDLAVYDQNTQLWYIYSLVTRRAIAWKLNFGFAGGIPVSGDYNGDGTTDFAVYNPSTGKWYIRDLTGTILMWDLTLGGGAAVPVKP